MRLGDMRGRPAKLEELLFAAARRGEVPEGTAEWQRSLMNDVRRVAERRISSIPPAREGIGLLMEEAVLGRFALMSSVVAAVCVVLGLTREVTDSGGLELFAFDDVPYASAYLYDVDDVEL